MKQIVFNLSDDFRLSIETYAKMYELENNSTELLIRTPKIMDGFFYELHKEQNGVKNVVILEHTPEGLRYIVSNGFLAKAGNACLQIRATSDTEAIESNIVDFRIGRFINATDEPTPEERSIIERLLIQNEQLTKELKDVKETAIFIE